MKHLKVLISNKIHTLLVNHMTNKVSPDCRITITKSNFPRVYNEISYEPFFSDYYVVIVIMNGFSKDDIKKLLKFDYCKYIFLCNELRQFNLLEDIENIATLINSRPPQWLFDSYVKKELPKLNITEINRFYRRLYPDFKNLDHFISLIRGTENVNKTVPISNKLSLQGFFFALLLGGKPKQVFTFLNEYRYGFKFLLEFLQDELKKLIELYEEFYNGKFNKQNLKEYASKNKLGQGYLIKCTEVFEKISLDELLLIEEELNNVTASSFNLYKVVFSIFYRSKVL